MLITRCHWQEKRSTRLAAARSTLTRPTAPGSTIPDHVADGSTAPGTAVAASTAPKPTIVAPCCRGPPASDLHSLSRSLNLLATDLRCRGLLAMDPPLPNVIQATMAELTPKPTHPSYAFPSLPALPFATAATGASRSSIGAAGSKVRGREWVEASRRREKEES
ncbi:hypothetical protein E2562_013122 [Oryza meyeriana var. granulata]|uniref:Uncharacterized protein n=1 Tax=Oryza meyeriana var. granulata TaxID=110450 RepID=A0A6G1F7U3_9ORYZ|nr:hypothetical protein E2562_013122 [Oryza meyeriana var. granulata]